MIWSVWSGLSKELFLKDFINYKLKKNNKKIVNDTFLSIDRLFKLSKKYKKKIISLEKVLAFEDVEYFIFFDMPDFKDPLIKKIKKYKKKFILITVEAREIHPQNFNLKLYKNFKYIFTYNDLFVDNRKIFYYHFGVNKKNILKKTKNDKFLCMISSNRIINFNNSLYPLRFKIISWFEKNPFWVFDLYGQGWDIKLFYSKYRLFKFINRINYFFRFIRNNFKNYKGEIGPFLKDKFNILQNYKFSFVIENFNSTNGWITEKIFHCFFCNVIPIYIGPPNINKYIPKNCYIDFYKFFSLEELCKYLKNLSIKEQKKYIENKNNFLRNVKFDKFDIDKCSSIIEKKLIFDVK